MKATSSLESVSQISDLPPCVETALDEAMGCLPRPDALDLEEGVYRAWADFALNGRAYEVRRLAAPHPSLRAVVAAVTGRWMPASA